MSAERTEIDTEILEAVCADFQKRLHAGEAVRVEDYVCKYPDMADDVERMLATLKALEFSVHAPMSVIPSTISGCQIVRRIGSGGMGTVYEARHPKISRRLAIKVLHPNDDPAGELPKRFLREAEAVSHLAHPNIVGLLDFGDDGGMPFLSMPYIDGLSLNHFVASEQDDLLTSVCPLPITKHPFRTSDGVAEASIFVRVANLGASVASALQHAHEHGIIHRDIKPANLILDRNDRIWITDFGLASVAHVDFGLSAAGTTIGTPRYMAPEQIRGKSDPRSDVYSLGVTLYELLTGKHAWGCIDSVDSLVVRSSLELPCPREVNTDLPPELAKIVTTACSLHPEDRYQTAAELEAVLNRFADGTFAPDRRRSQRVRNQRLSWRKSSILLTAAATFVGGCLVSRWLASGSDTTASLSAPIPHSITSVESPSQTLTIFENETISGLVLPTMDLHSGLINWTVIGGADSQLFRVNRTDGCLRLTEAADFEAPNDANSDNVFEVNVRIHSEVASEIVRVQAEVIDVAETDDPQSIVFFHDDRVDRIVTFNPATNTFMETSIPPLGFCAVATADGRTFFHVNILANGPALFRSTLDNAGKFRSVLVNANCSDLRDIAGWTTDDGIRFKAIRNANGGRTLAQLRIDKNGTVFSLKETLITKAFPASFFGLIHREDGSLMTAASEVDGLTISELGALKGTKIIPVNISGTLTVERRLMPVGIAGWAGIQNRTHHHTDQLNRR